VEREAGKTAAPTHWSRYRAPIGALVGLAAANATNDLEQETFSVLPFVTNAQGTENTGEWALAGAGIGAAVGAIFGYLVQTDRWQAMPTSELQLHATFSPAGPSSVGIAFQF
jgi:hypothetical protein